MIDYLRYYFPVGMFAVAFLGFALGGNWVWLCLITLAYWRLQGFLSISSG